MDLTIIIFTRNESLNIKECLESAFKLSKNILIVDMHSTDDTLKEAQKFPVKILSFPYLHYVEPAREFGISNAKTSWVFILDADERVTPELANEIKLAIGDELSVVSKNLRSKTHFFIPRKNIFGRLKWLRHGGWWPDYQIRLINKKYFRSWPKQIHSTPIIVGSPSYLINPLTHFFHGDLTQMLIKTSIFENIEAELLFKANKSVNTFTFFRKFCGEFYKRMIRHLGFLDGSIGIIESIYQAFSKTVTYLYLYEKRAKIDQKTSSRSI